MSRIFPSLAIVSIVIMLVAFGFGYTIEDAAGRDAKNLSGIRWHFFLGLGSLVFTSLVHSIVLTYFMGTGRWLEETQKAYRLSDEYFAASKKIKYRTIPLMVLGIFLLVMTGAFGAMADPAAGRSSFEGFLGFSKAKVHFGMAALTVFTNMMIHINEFQAVRKNGGIIDRVLANVRQIREEHGLPTEDWAQPGKQPAEVKANS